MGKKISTVNSWVRATVTDRETIEGGGGGGGCWGGGGFVRGGGGGGWGGGGGGGGWWGGGGGWTFHFRGCSRRDTLKIGMGK